MAGEIHHADCTGCGPGLAIAEGHLSGVGDACFQRRAYPQRFGSSIAEAKAILTARTWLVPHQDTLALRRRFI